MAAAPVQASQTECTVVESRWLGDYRLVSFVARDIAAEARSGQFIMVRLAGPDLDPLLPRPLCIHDIESDLVKVLIEPVGKGTRELTAAKVGDWLSVLGPLGNGFDLEGEGPALLVGGGIGAAPLLLLARELARAGRDVRCLLGFRTRSQAVAGELFRDFRFDIFTEDGSTGRRGLVSEPIKGCIDAAGAESGKPVGIFACGPDPMLAAVARVAAECGVRAQVSAAAHMACGVGACQGCVIKTVFGYRRVCSDGPVFEAGDPEW